MYFRDRISDAHQKEAGFLAELGDETIRQAASFVLGIHFANTLSCDSRCLFGQIDNRKKSVGKF
jgi:hypothetical protein